MTDFTVYRDSDEQRMRPSQVFARRLRETRNARGLTQTELAEHMTDTGRPMTKRAILAIENGTRGIQLDEALELAMTLRAAPAGLLAPPEGAVLDLTDSWSVDGEALRNWLVTGNPMSRPTSGEDDATDALREDLTHYAQALVDAIRSRDEAGRNTAYRAMVTAVDDYRLATKGGDDA